VRRPPLSDGHSADRRIRLPQKAPDRIDLVGVLRADPSAVMVWLRRRRVRRRRRSYRTQHWDGRRVDLLADLQAELDRERCGARISRGQLCQLLGIDQQRHVPAGPALGLSRTPAGSRSPL
jgi:hypothetical protein